MLKGQVNGLLASLGLADMNLRQLLTQGVNLGVPLFRSCLRRNSRNPISNRSSCLYVVLAEIIVFFGWAS